jgi:shikimate dehydrogenase
MKKKYGLIGYPLSHSFSQQYFTDKFKQLNLKGYEYKLYPVNVLDNVRDIVIKENLNGFNVTIPHKISIINYLDSISGEAQTVGAVNTVKITYQNNQLLLAGYNTDVYGFAQSIKPYLESHHYKALILGTGGASKAVAYVLRNLGVEFLFVTRNPITENQIGYNQLNKMAIAMFPLIINTTPLGMYPFIDNYPLIPYDGIDSRHLAIDLIYNPPVTRFLSMAQQRGAKTLNGLSMLHLQAEKAWEIWTSQSDT